MGLAPPPKKKTIHSSRKIKLYIIIDIKIKGFQIVNVFLGKNSTKQVGDLIFHLGVILRFSPGRMRCNGKSNPILWVNPLYQDFRASRATEYIFKTNISYYFIIN